MLDGGKIVACGNHNQLMQTSDIYREIYEAQTRGKATEEELAAAECDENGEGGAL